MTSKVRLNSFEEAFKGLLLKAIYPIFEEKEAQL